MRSSLVLLKAATVAREAGASVVPLFDDGCSVFFQLAEKDLEAAKTPLKRALVDSGVVGRPAGRAIEKATSAEELKGVAEDFGFGACFTAGRSGGDITDEVLEAALSIEAMKQLPRAMLVNWLADDKSGWWRRDENVPHLAEIVAELCRGDSLLGGELLTVLGLEVTFERMMDDSECVPRFAAFCAGLRAGVRDSRAFDAALLRIFSVAELVGAADRDAVWGFCKEQLQLAAGEKAEGEEEAGDLPAAAPLRDEPPARSRGRDMTPETPLVRSPRLEPPQIPLRMSGAPRVAETVKCPACEKANPSGTKFCQECGQHLEESVRAPADPSEAGY